MHIRSKDSWLKHFDFIIWDILIYFVSFILSNYIYFGRLNRYPSQLMITVFLCISLPCFIIDLTYSPFSGVLRRDTIAEIRNAFRFTAYDLIVSIILMYVLKIGGLFSRVTFVLTYIIYLILIIIVRISWKKLLFSKKLSFFPSSNNSLLIISSAKDIRKTLNNINKEEYQQYEIRGLCLLDNEKDEKKIYDYDVVCDINSIYSYAISHNIGEIFVAASPNVLDSSTVSRLIDEGIGIHLDISKIYGIETDQQSVDKVGIYKTLGLGLYTFSFRQSIYLVFKRIFDIVISLLAMIPLLLVTLFIKIVYVLSGDRSSIFFHQRRVGQYGKPFELYKFRTMVPDAQEVLKELLKDENNLKEWNEFHKFKHDPRITKAGSFLRKTSLDEFPQFINVLKGDMSLIGPRPLVEGELKMHNGLKLYERVKPGITGWWACNGRSNISYDERLEMEYYYVKNCSLGLDIFTFMRTIFVVLRKTGAE